MKPAPFRYARPATAAEAVALLASARGDAKLLAGGQSLVALLNMRLVRPTVLVDLNGARELERIDGAPDEVPLRRGRPAPHVDVHGLPQAHRGGRAHHRGRPARASVAGQPARGEGSRGRRLDPGARRGGQRGGGRARPPGRGGTLAADHPGAGVAVAARGLRVGVASIGAPGSRTRRPVSARPASARLNASVTWLTGSTQKNGSVGGVNTTR